MKNIVVKDKIINITGINDEDYVSLTDIARIKNTDFPSDVVKNWLRLKSTIEYLGLWESINNLNFNSVEFDAFMKSAGSNAFVLTPSKWVKEKRFYLKFYKNDVKLISYLWVLKTHVETD